MQWTVPERQLLSDATEDEYGLWEAVESLASLYPDAPRAELADLARRSLLNLLRAGLISLVRTRSVPAETEAERREVLEKLPFVPRTQRGLLRRELVDLDALEAEAALAPPDAFLPPEGESGHSWYETWHVGFWATDAGNQLYFSWGPDETADLH